MNIDVVWTWPAAIAAAVSGLLYSGFFVLSFLTLRRRRGYPLVVGVNVLVGTFMFTVGQMAAALYTGDPLWFRVGSRYGMWLPFALALVLVIAVAVKRQRGKDVSR